MGKEDTLKVLGKVEEVLRNSVFRVRLENEAIVTAHLSGKLRMHTIKIILGDTVELELSPYDLTKARIVYRR